MEVYFEKTPCTWRALIDVERHSLKLMTSDMQEFDSEEETCRIIAKGLKLIIGSLYKDFLIRC